MISFISAMPLIATNKKDYRGFVHSRDYKASNFIGHVFCNIEKNNNKEKSGLHEAHREERRGEEGCWLSVTRNHSSQREKAARYVGSVMIPVFVIMDPKIPINYDIWPHKISWSRISLSSFHKCSSDFKIACCADLALKGRVWYPISIPKLQPDLDLTSGIPDLSSMTLAYSPPIPYPIPLIHDATYYYYFTGAHDSENVLSMCVLGLTSLSILRYTL